MGPGWCGCIDFYVGVGQRGGAKTGNVQDDSKKQSEWCLNGHVGAEWMWCRVACSTAEPTDWAGIKTNSAAPSRREGVTGWGRCHGSHDFTMETVLFGDTARPADMDCRQSYISLLHLPAFKKIRVYVWERDDVRKGQNRSGKKKKNSAMIIKIIHPELHLWALREFILLKLDFTALTRSMSCSLLNFFPLFGDLILPVRGVKTKRSPSHFCHYTC